MFKVSFKEKDNCPSKVVEKIGKKTTVYYKGTVALPKFWWYLPKKIYDWIGNIGSLEIYENMATNELIIYAKGTAKCAEGDTYDSLLGERLAEAKAKLVIYRFFRDLSLKICHYYSDILTGEWGFTGTYLYKDKGLAGDYNKYSKLCKTEEAHIIKLLSNDGSK